MTTLPTLREVQVKYEELWPHDPRTYCHLLNEHWRRWQKHGNDEAAGAHAGASFSPQQHTHAELILGSRTIRDSFERAFAFYNTYNPHTRYALETSTDQVESVIRYPAGLEPERADAEYRVTLLASIIRWLIPDPLTSMCVRFRTAPPSYRHELERVLACAVQFDAEVDSLIVEPRTMEAPIWGSEYVASRIGKVFADELAAYRGPRTLAEQVAAAIRGTLLTGEGGIKSIAPHFGISPRTLQRRLENEGTAYQTILDATRNRLCIEMLQNPELPVGQIAVLLGYSNPSNFLRAFRRWFGMTPRRFRQQMRNRGPLGGDPPSPPGNRAADGTARNPGAEEHPA
jgi:AraC-like DNA-binding protein